MTGGAAPALLDEAQARFLTERVSILAASCNSACEPSVARAFGCRVAPDRRSITVFLSVAQSAALLSGVRCGAAVAVVFSRPTTHQTLQLKGAEARIVSLEPGDRALMRDYGQSFRDEISALGFDDAFTSAILAAVEEEAVGLVFEPIAAFEQTPGPLAGQPLRSMP